MILTYHKIKKAKFNIVSLSLSNALLVFNTCMMRERREEKYIYDYISVRTINQVFLVVASLLTMCVMCVRMYMCESLFNR
jgi:hypothetical protein